MHEQGKTESARESSESDKKGNWVEDVAKIAGDVSAGAVAVSVLTAWAPSFAAADVVSAFSGLIALGADGYLYLRGERSATALGLDAVALAPAAGLAKEGAKVVEQLRSGNMMHPILYGVKEFAADEKMWAVVGKTYQELGGGIVSVANRLYEGNNRLNDK